LAWVYFPEREAEMEWNGRAGNGYWVTEWERGVGIMKWPDRREGGGGQA